jgi:cation transport protein ChaC
VYSGRHYYIEIRGQMGHDAFAAPPPRYVFGYGSLIWRPSFDHVAAHDGVARGWRRRFYQYSPDHRGTPELHGRVATLSRSASSEDVVHGVVYELRQSTATDVMAALWHREQAGYSMTTLEVECVDGVTRAAATFYATHENEYWAGPPPAVGVTAAAAADVAGGDDAHLCCDGGPPPHDHPWCLRSTARVIAVARGPSGSNVEYLAALLASLRRRGVRDAYLEALWTHVLLEARGRRDGGEGDGSHGLLLVDGAAAVAASRH